MNLTAEAASHSQVEPDMRTFSQIPVLHEGRVKPMDSLARVTLKTLSGRESLKNMTAVEWLAEVLFDPARAMQIPVIKINNPDIRVLLDLEKTLSNLYTYQDVSQSFSRHKNIITSTFETPEKSRTPAQKSLVLLYYNLQSFDEALESLSAFLPLAISPDVSWPPLLQDIEKPITYLDLVRVQERLEMQTKAIVKNKGSDIAGYSEEERLLAYLSFTKVQLQEKNQRNQWLNIFPENVDEWASPWSVINQASPPHPTFKNWQDMALAWHKRDMAVWNENVEKVFQSLNKTQNLRVRALRMEYMFNKTHPFSISALFYALSLMAFTVAVLFKRKMALPTAAAFLIVGFVVHFGGVVFRVFILQRPPVSTLYESILFVGLIITGYSVYNWLRHTRNNDLLMGALAGVILHQVGFAHEGSGDSLMMLSAVLNTNFWLATHVICITAGYAFCLITSFMAQLVLLKYATKSAYIDDHIKTLQIVSIVALLLSVLGTVLGGIWADQSWGRFWGWDPKENGALLIVLWLIWVMHGRIAGQFSTLWYVAGLAYLSVIVSISWFGVNLLSVGLHAYGFTDKAFWSLVGFFICQTSFLCWLMLRAHWRRAVS